MCRGSGRHHSSLSLILIPALRVVGKAGVHFPPPYSSSLAEQDSVGQVEERGGRQNGETRTVCDDTTERTSLEVKFNIHVFSLQRQERLCFHLFSPEQVCAAFLLKSPCPLCPLLPDQMCTHKSRGVVVANGLGIAESCRDEEGK